jgi:hypothetical protein
MSGSDAALAGGLRQCGMCRTSAMDEWKNELAKQQVKGATAAEL